MSQVQPCRLCGTNESVKLISLTEQVHAKYLKKISDLLNIVIHAGDPLPKVLCHRCVIKVDDFEMFLEDAHRTQEQLSKIYKPCSELYPTSKEIVSAPMFFRQHSPPYTMISRRRKFSDTESSPIQPPAIIQLNLLTCSNANENVSDNVNFGEDPKGHRVPKGHTVYQPNTSSRVAVPNRTITVGDITGIGKSPLTPESWYPAHSRLNPASSDSENGSRLTMICNQGVNSSRRGSRPFPNKLTHQKNSTCVPTSEETARLQVLSAEESSETKSSSVSSSPVMKKKKYKKYQNPFCVPARKTRKRVSRGGQTQKNKQKEKSSSNEESVESPEEVGPLREEDLGKYFILTKNPAVGTIYTCMACATILTSSKAACNHTKCVNKAQIQSDEDDDEDDDESSNDESSDPEPSDNSRSDTTEQETIYACQFCDKPFTRNVVRLQHERIHLLDLSDSDADCTYSSRKPKRKDYNRSLVEQFLIR